VRVPNQQHFGIACKPHDISRPSWGAGSQSEFNTANGGAENITESCAVGPFNPVGYFQILDQSAAAGQGMDRFTKADQTRCRHSETLAGGAFQPNVHLQPFLRSKQGGFTAGFKEVEIEFGVLKVFPMHGCNGDHGRFGFQNGLWPTRRDAVHLPSIVLFDAMERSFDLNTMVNGKTRAPASLASHQGVGFVNAEQERDVTAATLNGRGRHHAERGGDG
jgi:hypothetical protein